MRNEIDEEEVSMTEEERIQDKKRRRKQRTLTFMKVCNVFLILILAVYVAVAAVGIKLISNYAKDMPSLKIEDFVSAESSKIYDANGSLVYELGTYLRENVSYDDFPESLIDAFVAIEDSRYFTHFGIDIPRLTAAAITDIVTRSKAQGASTFTMQLVKNTYFTIDAGDQSVSYDQSIGYKVQQILLSLQLEQKLGKKEIMQLFLNKLNFGQNIRGVQMASQFYFGKDCTELNTSESALLAGIINLPNLYNPYEYLDYATERRNTVLYQMLNHGYITLDEYNLAKAINIEDQLVGAYETIQLDTKYQSYVDVVLNEAVDMTGYDPNYVGMEIYTALEPLIQSQIEAIQNEETHVKYADELMQTAIISMNNQTGEIVAIGGGRNYGSSGGNRLFNRATDMFKQPGSSVKPVLSYALAFEYLGFSLDEVLVDKPITFPYETRVLVNANGEYAGDVEIKTAVAYSLNTPAILTLERVQDKIGKDAVIDYMQKIGFSYVNEDNYHESAAIGGIWFETTCEELAGAHSTIMNGGVYNDPHTIRRINFSNGKIAYPEGLDQRIISEGSAWLASQLMQYNVDSQIYNFMHILKRDYPVYAKTGTTDWGSDGLQYGIPEGAMKDKWMVSSTSQYTNVVWCGYDQAEKGKDTYFQTWKSYLNIPGNINNLLLDVEELVSPNTLGGFSRPSDIKDVTYVYGTYPHVQAESWMPSYKLVTSQVSEAGLKNQPTISSEEFTSGTPVLTGLSASVSNGNMISINWETGSNGACSGYRDISLHNEENDISLTGACLADFTFLYYNGNNRFNATILVNGYTMGHVTSYSGYYTGYPVNASGSVTVCGTYSNASGTSEQMCVYAGEMVYYEPEYYYDDDDDSGDDDGGGEETPVDPEPSDDE